MGMGVKLTARGSRPVCSTVQVSPRGTLVQGSDRKPRRKWAEADFPLLLLSGRGRATGETRRGGGDRGGGSTQKPLPAAENDHPQPPFSAPTGPFVVSPKIMLLKRTSARVSLSVLLQANWLLLLRLRLAHARFLPNASFSPQSLISFQYGEESPSKGEGRELQKGKGLARNGHGECWSAIEEVSLAAAQEGSSTHDTLARAKAASLALLIFEKPYLKVHRMFSPLRIYF